MAAEKVRDLAEAYAMLDRLPADAEQQLGVELAIIGRDVLADQRRLVPKDTGELDGHLSLQLLVRDLKVRVGLFIAGKKYGGEKRVQGGRDAYYGRFVALGRSGQTVVVTRRIKDRTLRGNNRFNKKRQFDPRRTIYNYQTTKLRKSGPNKGTPTGSPYKMKVPFMAARDFIRVPGAEATAAGQLAEFWSRLLDRQGA